MNYAKLKIILLITQRGKELRRLFNMADMLTTHHMFHNVITERQDITIITYTCKLCCSLTAKKNNVNLIFVVESSNTFMLKKDVFVF